MGDKYRIQDVGPIHEYELELRPGVNILRGRNGVGKSTATRAVAKTIGGDEGQLSVRDGADEGIVEGPGVTLRIGHKMTTRGEPAVELDHYGALDRLIDPRIKDPKARAKAEVEALLEFLDVRVDAEDIYRLASEEEQVAAAVEGLVVRSKGQVPILQAVLSIRQTAHALARESEKRLETEKARLQAQEEALGDLGWEKGEVPDWAEYPEEEMEELEAAHRQAEVQAARMRQAAEDRLALLDRQRQVRETMGEEPDIKAARQAVEKAQGEVERLKAELKAATERLGELEERRGEVEGAHDRWKQAQEILEREAEGPSMEEAADAESDAELAGEKLAKARERDRVKVVWDRLVGQRELVGDRESEIRHFRAIAHGVASQTRQLLEGRGMPGLEIDPQKGITYAGEETEGLLRPWSDLSVGQRTRIALTIAAQRAEAQGWARVLPLDPGWWMSLQPERRQEIAEVAQEHELEILTEEPSDSDELSVEHLP